MAALAAGAASGAGETASQAVKDAYAGLKALIRRKFAGDPKAEETLAEHEADPDTYEKPLAKKLKETGADEDEAVLSAAQALLAAMGADPQSGKYRVDARGSQGVQVGDHGTMTNNFGVIPD